MALTPGARLGHYEIVAFIGAGGMGEVFEARDPRLNRTVAIKVLSDDLSNQPEARARFEREARAIAGLNQAVICGPTPVARAMTSPRTDVFMVQPVVAREQAATSINVAINWFDDLKSRESAAN